MEGNGLPDKCSILPVPKALENGELEITTLLTRTGWDYWLRYDLPWVSELQNKTITIAAPRNDGAFQPMSTWTTIVSYPPNVDRLMALCIANRVSLR